MPPDPIYRFGLFEARPGSGTLLRQGVRVKLQDQPFRLLVLLLEHAGEVVSREELQQRIWPADTFVEFQGSLNATLKRLRAALGDPADHPTFIETIPKRGYRFIAAVTLDESGRVQDEPPKVVIPEIPLPAPQTSWQRIVRLTASLVVIFGVVLGWYVRRPLAHVRSSPSVQAQPTGVSARPAVAVLGFTNLSGHSDEAWLNTAFSEMLSTELAAGEKLRLVPGEDISNLRLASPWPRTDTLNRDTTSRIGERLSSDFLVLGSYTALAKSNSNLLRVDVRLQNARTGEILTEVAESGNSQDLFRVVSRIGAKLRDKLGVSTLADRDAAGVLASLPLDPDAARFYALGLAKLRAYDALAAKDLLEEASESDPKFSLVHAMLARAWAQLGYEQKRKQEAKKAYDLSTDLPRPERMLVEAEYYESLANHEKAASVYHALFQLYPDSLDYGLALAGAQLAAGHGTQSQETLAQLRRLPGPASSDPRIDLAEASTSIAKPAILRLIRSAIQKASSQDNKLVYATARRDECVHLLYTDEPDSAVAACREAYRIFSAAGNKVGAADALRLIADSQGTQGHYGEAIATYQDAVNILKGTGELKKTGSILNNMAIAFAAEGNLKRAEKLYREAESHFEQAGDLANTATALGNIADVLYSRGQLAAATKVYRQALDIEAHLEPNDPGYELYRLADLELAQGRVQQAQRLAEEAVDALKREQGAYQYLTGAMIELGETFEAEGNLPAARQQIEGTISLRQKIGSLDLLAESQVELAQLDLEEGHPELAEPLLRKAIPEFEKENAAPDSASAYLLLSRVLLQQGKLEEARDAFARAAKLGRTNPGPALKLPLAIQHARLEIAPVNPTQSGEALTTARRELQTVAATATKLGYYGIQCEARLELSELEAKINPAAGRAQLKSLAAEARSHGLELVARKAEKGLTSSTELVASTNR